ncbi:MAG: FAD-dependent oxidoreductase, partial [Firmicutes bacterium]|nr:FAD-dependent oxidoreductase [Bacillota bacterium]
DLNLGSAHDIKAGEPTGKKAAIIGGGPGGLTAAYFLRRRGHEVTVYDAMPHMGGMLRYGIPEYRLPKAVLQSEIDAIAALGVELKNNIKIGRDLTLDYLREAYDAVVIAIGAWTSVGLGCPGEDLEGVYGGIDFLQDVALGKRVLTGGKVAVVGGGNTAMDACRTAVRLGASEVYNVYRRTKNEMPAEEIEIIEAEEEGVIFKNLTNPIEVIGEDGKVKAMRLQIMELGEPDESGRRKPVEVKGKEETVEIDAVIVAIGQKTASEGFEAVEHTRWKTIIADEKTFQTNLDGVFAIGDATNDGAGIAIAAIGEAGRAAEIIDKFLNGEELKCQPEFLVTDTLTAEDFPDEEKIPRATTRHRAPDVRRNDFLAYDFGLTEADAVKEASRCLECGCHDYFECKLINYANLYAVNPEKYGGREHHICGADENPFINRTPDKCILCGLCVRICEEVVGAGAIGLIDRGFGMTVSPALDQGLEEAGCISCGQCVTVCPTGALTETMALGKQVPLAETVTETVCPSCSVGCKSRLASNGGLLIRNLPADNQMLCEKGRFKFDDTDSDRLTHPRIRNNGGFEKATFENAAVHANKGLQGVQAVYGADSIAVAISGRYTNEEARLIKEYAGKINAPVFSFGLLGGSLPASTATLDEMESTDLIIAVLPDTIMKEHAVAGMRIKRAVKRGAKLIIISAEHSLLDDIADFNLSASLLGQLAAALSGAYAAAEAKEAADMISKAKKAVFIFPRSAVYAQEAQLIAHIAELSDHAGKPRNGVIQLLSEANSQGLADLGVEPCEKYIRAMAEGKLRGLFVFGTVPGIDLRKLDFLAIQTSRLTEAAEAADVIFPASTFAEVSGTYTAADGTVSRLTAAAPCALGKWDNAAQVRALMG